MAYPLIIVGLATLVATLYLDAERRRREQQSRRRLARRMRQQRAHDIRRAADKAAGLLTPD